MVPYFGDNGVTTAVSTVSAKMSDMAANYWVVATDASSSDPNFSGAAQRAASQASAVHVSMAAFQVLQSCRVTNNITLISIPPLQEGGCILRGTGNLLTHGCMHLPC